jgi:hypothetical protein
MPHQRESCPVYVFRRHKHSYYVGEPLTDEESVKKNKLYCPNCYCLVCDVRAAECPSWDRHFAATVSGSQFKAEKAVRKHKILKLLSVNARNTVLENQFVFRLLGRHDAPIVGGAVHIIEKGNASLQICISYLRRIMAERYNVAPVGVDITRCSPATKLFAVVPAVNSGDQPGPPSENLTSDAALRKNETVIDLSAADDGTDNGEQQFVPRRNVFERSPYDTNDSDEYDSDEYNVGYDDGNGFFSVPSRCESFVETSHYEWGRTENMSCIMHYSDKCSLERRVPFGDSESDVQDAVVEVLLTSLFFLNHCRPCPVVSKSHELPFCTDEMKGFVSEQCGQYQNGLSQVVSRLAKDLKGKMLWYANCSSAGSIVSTNSDKYTDQERRLQNAKQIGKVSGFSLPLHLVEASDFLQNCLLFDALTSVGVQPAPEVDYLFAKPVGPDKFWVYGSLHWDGLAMKICHLENYPTSQKLRLMSKVLPMSTDSSLQTANQSYWNYERLFGGALYSENFGCAATVLSLLLSVLSLQRDNVTKLILPFEFSCKLFVKLVLPFVERVTFGHRQFNSYLYGLGDRLGSAATPSSDLKYGFPSNPSMDTIQGVHQVSYLLLAGWSYFDIVAQSDPESFCKHFFELSPETGSLGVIQKKAFTYFSKFNSAFPSRPFSGSNLVPFLLIKESIYGTSVVTDFELPWLTVDAFEKFGNKMVYFELPEVKASFVDIYNEGRSRVSQILLTSTIPGGSSESISSDSTSRTMRAVELFPLLKRQIFQLLSPAGTWDFVTSMVSEKFGAVQPKTEAIFLSSLKVLNGLALLSGITIEISSYSILVTFMSIFKAMDENILKRIIKSRRSCGFTVAHIFYKMGHFLLERQDKLQAFLNHSDVNIAAYPKTFLQFFRFIKECLSQISSAKGFLLPLSKPHEDASDSPTIPCSEVKFACSLAEQTDFDVIEQHLRPSEICCWSFWRRLVQHIFIHLRAEGGLTANASYPSIFGDIVRRCFAYENLSLADMLLLFTNWSPTAELLYSITTADIAAFFGSFRDILFLALDMKDNWLVENIMLIGHVFCNEEDFSKTVVSAYVEALYDCQLKSQFLEACLRYASGVVTRLKIADVPTIVVRLDTAINPTVYMKRLALATSDPDIINYFIRTEPLSEPDEKLGTEGFVAASRMSIINSLGRYVTLRAKVAAPESDTAKVASTKWNVDGVMGNMLASAFLVGADISLVERVLYEERAVCYAMPLNGIDSVSAETESVCGGSSSSSSDNMKSSVSVGMWAVVLRCLDVPMSLHQLNGVLQTINLLVADLCVDSSYTAEKLSLLRCLRRHLPGGIDCADNLLRDDVVDRLLAVGLTEYQAVAEAVFYTAVESHRHKLLSNCHELRQCQRVIDWLEVVHKKKIISSPEYFGLVLPYFDASTVYKTICDGEFQFVVARLCSANSHVGPKIYNYYDDQPDAFVPILENPVTSFCRLLALVTDCDMRADLRALYFSWVVKMAVQSPGSLHFDLSGIDTLEVAEGGSWRDNAHKNKALVVTLLERTQKMIECENEAVAFKMEEDVDWHLWPAPTEALAILYMHLLPDQVDGFFSSLTEPTKQQSWSYSNRIMLASSLRECYVDHLIGPRALLRLGGPAIVIQMLSDMTDHEAAMSIMIAFLDEGLMNCLFTDGLVSFACADAADSVSDKTGVGKVHVAWPYVGCGKQLFSDSALLFTTGLLDWIIKLSLRCRNINSIVGPTESLDTGYCRTQDQTGDVYYLMEASEQVKFDLAFAGMMQGEFESSACQYSGMSKAALEFRKTTDEIYYKEYVRSLDGNIGSCRHIFYDDVPDETATSLAEIFRVLSSALRQAAGLKTLCSDIVELCSDFSVGAGERLLMAQCEPTECSGVRPGPEIVRSILSLYLNQSLFSNNIHYNLLLCQRIMGLFTQSREVKLGIEGKIIISKLCGRLLSPNGAMHVLTSWRYADAADIDYYFGQQMFLHFQYLVMTLQVSHRLQFKVVLYALDMVKHLVDCNKFAIMTPKEFLEKGRLLEMLLSSTKKYLFMDFLKGFSCNSVDEDSSVCYVQPILKPREFFERIRHLFKMCLESENDLSPFESWRCLLVRLIVMFATHCYSRTDKYDYNVRYQVANEKSFIENLLLFVLNCGSRGDANDIEKLQDYGMGLETAVAPGRVVDPSDSTVALPTSSNTPQVLVGSSIADDMDVVDISEGNYGMTDTAESMALATDFSAEVGIALPTVTGPKKEIPKYLHLSSKQSQIIWKVFKLPDWSTWTQRLLNSSSFLHSVRCQGLMKALLVSPITQIKPTDGDDIISQLCGVDYYLFDIKQLEFMELSKFITSLVSSESINGIPKNAWGNFCFDNYIVDTFLFRFISFLAAKNKKFEERNLPTLFSCMESYWNSVRFMPPAIRRLESCLMSLQIIFRSTGNPEHATMLDTHVRTLRALLKKKPKVVAVIAAFENAYHWPTHRVVAQKSGASYE